MLFRYIFEFLRINKLGLAQSLKPKAQSPKSILTWYLGFVLWALILFQSIKTRGWRPKPEVQVNMNFEHWALRFGLWASGFWDLGFGLRALGFGIRVSVFGLWAPVFGLQTWYWGTPCFVVLIEYRSGHSNYSIARKVIPWYLIFVLRKVWKGPLIYHFLP